MWLQVPDGYVRERGILFGALGPPSVVPFDPALHLPKEQVRLLAFLAVSVAFDNLLSHFFQPLLRLGPSRGGRMSSICNDDTHLHPHH